MKIVDAFEHTTTISFKNAKYNISLVDNDFLFKLPDGIDVVQSGAALNATASSSSIKNQDAEILTFINDWLSAWSSKETYLYLSKYAQEFKVHNWDSFSSWQNSRKQKIASQVKITIEIEEVKVIMKNENSARIQFKQKYTSDKFTEVSNKSLIIKKVDSKWLIQEEISGK